MRNRGAQLFLLQMAATVQKIVVIFGGSRKVKELNEQKRLSGCIATTSVNGWMNDDLTADYLRRVISRLAFKKRILVWNAYRCHLSDSTKKEL